MTKKNSAISNKLYALCQSHRYGQSITHEVLALNEDTARFSFQKDTGYTSVTHGRFFISEVFKPRPNEFVPPGYLDYTKQMKPGSVRLVRGFTREGSPSPFPDRGKENLGPLPPFPNKPPLSHSLAAYAKRAQRTIPQTVSRTPPIPKRWVPPTPTSIVPSGTPLKRGQRRPAQ